MCFTSVLPVSERISSWIVLNLEMPQPRQTRAWTPGKMMQMVNHLKIYCQIIPKLPSLNLWLQTHCICEDFAEECICFSLVILIRSWSPCAQGILGTHCSVLHRKGDPLFRRSWDQHLGVSWFIWCCHLACSKTINLLNIWNIKDNPVH